MKPFPGYFYSFLFICFICGRRGNCLDICDSGFCDCYSDVATCITTNDSITHDSLLIPEYISKVSFSDNGISNLDQLNHLYPIGEGVLTLDLSSNELQSLPECAFQHLNASLTTLYLQNNMIQSVHEQAFANIEALDKLVLSFNKIEDLPDGLFDQLINLQHLDLSFNSVERLKETVFMNLARLKELNLSFLHLGIIHPNVFDWNLTITHLDLSFNYLTSVPSKGLWYLRNTLEDLNLSGNLLQVLPAGSFFGLCHLKSISLEQLLYLEKIESYAFEDLENFETVVLRYLPNLRDINEKAFHLLENGNNTSLCPIRDFTIEFSTLPNLPERLLHWDQVRYISLRNNRWICDCRMKWIKGSHLQNITLNSMYCSAPFQYRGKNMHTLKKEELNCQELVLQSTGGALAILMIIVLAMLFSFTTVVVLVHRRNGWVFRPPRLFYDKVDSPLNTITIYDRGSVMSEINEIHDKEMVYIHDI